MHLCAIRAHFLHAHQVSFFRSLRLVHFRYHLNIFNCLIERNNLVMQNDKLAIVQRMSLRPVFFSVCVKDDKTPSCAVKRTN